MRSRRIRTIIVALLALGPVAGASAQGLNPVDAVSENPPAVQPAVVTTPSVEAEPLGVPTGSSLPTHESSALGGSTESAKIGLSRTLGALVGVVGVMLVVFMSFRWLANKRGGLIASLGAAGRAPSGIVEVLARYPIARTQRLVVLRIGRRVVVCCQTSGGRSSQGGMTTLTELTDAEEVAALLRSVRDFDGTSNTEVFKKALKSAEDDPATSSSPLDYRTEEGDTIQWQDERIHIPPDRSPRREIDPSIGRMRARLAAMRSHGDAA